MGVTFVIKTWYIFVMYVVCTSKDQIGKGQRVGVTRGDLSDSVRILIHIQRLTLLSHFCFVKTFIGGQDATIVVTYTD